MRKERIAAFADLELNKPLGALVENVDLVITRYGESEEEVSALYGRCLHRGALLADGFVSGKNLMCGVHFWDYRIDTGISELSNGIPIGFKLSAQHVEKDIDFALEAGADYIILDGRGGGTGSAPVIFRNHISVPTIPALARACGHDHLSKFRFDDLSTWDEKMHKLTGIAWAGVS